MKSLSTALDGIKNTANGLEQVGSMSNIQQPISTASAGMTNIPNSSSSENPANTQRPQPEDRQERKILISENPDDKKRLTALIKACYESLNTYGKSAANLESSIMLMQMTLGRFEYETVRAAFGVYLQHNSDMPKPADIIKIIEPPVQERKWCATTFIDIKRRMRENQFIMDSEKQYCNDFIAARIKAPEEQRNEIETAIKQVEQQNKQYWLE